MIVSSMVSLSQGPTSLSCYLARRFTYLSEEEWGERIRERRIFLNDVVCNDALRMLSHGDRIAYHLPEFMEPPADFNYSVVYDDEWILGVNKPGNLLVHKAGKSFRSNLIYQLRYCHRPSPYPSVNALHRLDRETSGIVLFAKDKAIARMMNDAFGKQAMGKEYYAIVKGIPLQRSWVVRLPIGTDETSPSRCKFRIDGVNGKIAETRFETLQALKNDCSFLRIRPITGRTHQIRVHLASCGLALIGDKVYGNGQINDRFLFPRQALHCFSIGFAHPIIKETTVISAPLPPDMTDLLNKLGGVSHLSMAKVKNETHQKTVA